jgi:predicted nucleic acid-binding protein
VDREPVTISTLDEIAARQSAYDAAYLELAMRRGIPLAIQDDALMGAMAKAGVPAAVPDT